MERIDRSAVRIVRYVVQGTILAATLFAGYRFYLFIDQLSRGMVPTVDRPPSVEGFLPIGALMSLKLWITEGIVDPVHPAALVIFVGALASSLVLKKSFCGWICPVGALSDAVWKAGRAIFGKNPVIPWFIDYPLRSLKYLLMGFFLYVIVVKMEPSAIIGFLNTPYWKVTDVKMLRFFTEMSGTTMITLGALLALSLIYKNFWCRYLCPYGALLGLLSMLSPVKIRRNAAACIDCGRCSKNCPSLLPVDKKETIRTAECTGCLTCVSACPSRGALDASVGRGGAVKPAIYTASVLIVFFGLVAAAQMTGNWHSSLSNEELRSLIPSLDHLDHP